MNTSTYLSALIGSILLASTATAQGARLIVRGSVASVDTPFFGGMFVGAEVGDLLQLEMVFDLPGTLAGANSIRYIVQTGGTAIHFKDRFHSDSFTTPRSVTLEEGSAFDAIAMDVYALPGSQELNLTIEDSSGQMLASPSIGTNGGTTITPGGPISAEFRLSNHAGSRVVMDFIDLRIEQIDADYVGSNYCGSTLNSTGRYGRIGAVGSEVAASNNLVLLAPDVPPFSLGFFLVSDMPGFVANPGGSQGNLCLAGEVGRYDRPSEFQYSGSQGIFRLGIDTTSIRRIAMDVPALAGQSWSFQAWHRDSVAGVATSNFTDAIYITFE